MNLASPDRPLLEQALRSTKSKALISLALGIVGLSPMMAQTSPMPWDVKTFQKTPVTFPAPEVTEDGLTSIYLQGPDFKGKPTKVFALYGLPKDTHGKKVPAIVLVHGAGGTAFAYWVRLWNSRGYAAIAFDYGSALPIGTMNKWQPNPDGGPPLGYPDTGQPPEEQWMYHAVADVMMCVSFLKSLPEVDGNKIGLTGISWGGVVASAVAGIDDRLKFVVPVYGCGFISHNFPDGSFFLKNEPANALVNWRSTWDPDNYLPKAKMPMLWLTGSNDPCFTMRVVDLSSRAAAGPQSFCIRLRMPHGHGGLGENPEEIHAFADSIVNNETPMAKITGQGHDEKKAWVTYNSKVKLVSAELEYTVDTGNWQDRNWQTAPAEIDDLGHKVVAALPPGTTHYYFNIVDERNLIVSSEYVVLTPPFDTPEEIQ